MDVAIRVLPPLGHLHLHYLRDFKRQFSLSVFYQCCMIEENERCFFLSTLCIAFLIAYYLICKCWRRIHFILIFKLPAQSKKRVE